MKLSYGLTIEQTQKLTMTPELIQAIRILQFNTQELDSFVQEELLENPVLEFENRRRDDEPLDGRITAQEAFQVVGTPATGTYGAAMPATPGAAAYTPGLQYDPITGALIGGC